MNYCTPEESQLTPAQISQRLDEWLDKQGIVPQVLEKALPSCSYRTIYRAIRLHSGGVRVSTGRESVQNVLLNLRAAFGNEAVGFLWDHDIDLDGDLPTQLAARIKGEEVLPLTDLG